MNRKEKRYLKFHVPGYKQALQCAVQANFANFRKMMERRWQQAESIEKFGKKAIQNNKKQEDEE